jgi:hypothetical protein
MRDAKEL